MVDTARNLSTGFSHDVSWATPEVEGAKIDRGVNNRIRQMGQGDLFAGTD